MKMALSESRGVSLPEILVVLAVAGILSAVSFASYITFNKHEALGKDAAKVVALFDEARSLSVGSKGGLSYGVHIESDKVTRFAAPTYSAGASGNSVELLTPYVTISNISLAGGGSDVFFSKTAGTTTKSGTLTLSLVSNAAKTKTIMINQTGLVEIVN